MGSRARRHDAGVEQYATRQYMGPSSGGEHRPEYPNPTYYNQRGQVAPNYAYAPVQTAQYGTSPAKAPTAGTVYHPNTNYKPASRLRRILLYGIAISLLIVAIVVLCVYFAVIRPKTSSNNRASNAGSQHPSTPSPSHTTSPGKPVSGPRPTTGGDGSTVTMEDGSTFVYRNSFGGFWIDDPNDPFNNGARPQSWSPALNETFRYGIDQIRGCVCFSRLPHVPVNNFLQSQRWRMAKHRTGACCRFSPSTSHILRVEWHSFSLCLSSRSRSRSCALNPPYRIPALYQKYSGNNEPGPPLDEWMLSFAMRADPAAGGINQIEDHYKTFVVRRLYFAGSI